jgi:type VI secretion system secreted protein VgrG
VADEIRELESIDIAFSSGADVDGLLLHGVWGRERISRLFTFDLLLSRAKGPLTDADLDALLKAPCAIALGLKPGDVVHGVLESIDALDQTSAVAARYIARLVPNVWLLTLGRASRVYQDTTVPDMVRLILESYGMQEGKQFNILVNRAAKSPKREYIVQYQESDWDFIQRWLENEGFFYWFSHDAEGEMLIIADENDDATAIDDPEKVQYRERNNLSSGGIATIWNWTLHQRRIPARLALLDYNYRRPDVPLAVNQPVDPERGFGTVVQYGEHFKDNETGKAIATLRAEQLKCERRIYAGVTDCSRFRVGHSFDLDNHYDTANDGKYLITSIEHRVGQPFDMENDAPQRYSATFEAIPFDVAFRPERITPWPRIHGFVHAHIDSDSEGEFADLDSEGRYRVRMPFDMTMKKGTAASRWIRMAQQYAGAGYGSHHPLHKGAEVLISHVEGDPDRPVITGSIPNAHTLSPTTSVNASQSVVQTASGIRVEYEDMQS